LKYYRLNLSVAYDLVAKKDWEKFAERLADSLQSLHRAGAEIATHTDTARLLNDNNLIKPTLVWVQRISCSRIRVYGGITV